MGVEFNSLFADVEGYDGVHQMAREGISRWFSLASGAQTYKVKPEKDFEIPGETGGGFIPASVDRLSYRIVFSVSSVYSQNIARRLLRCPLLEGAGFSYNTLCGQGIRTRLTGCPKTQLPSSRIADGTKSHLESAIEASPPKYPQMDRASLSRAMLTLYICFRTGLRRTFVCQEC